MSCLYPIPAHDTHGQKAKPLPKESAINFNTFNRSVKRSMQAMLHLPFINTRRDRTMQ